MHRKYEAYLSVLDLILTPEVMGCLRLVYHGGGVDSTPPNISAPMAPMDMKLYILEVFGLYL